MHDNCLTLGILIKRKLERCHNIKSCHQEGRAILCMILHFKVLLHFCEMDCYDPMIMCVHIRRNCRP